VLINEAVSSPAYGPSSAPTSASTLSFDDGFEDLDELYDKDFKEGEICAVSCTSFAKLNGCTKNFFMSMKLKPMTKSQIKEATEVITKGKVLPNCKTVLKGERNLLTAAQKKQGQDVFTKLCQFSCVNNIPFQQVEIPKTLKTFTVSTSGVFDVNGESSTPINPTTGTESPPPPPLSGGIKTPPAGPNGGPGGPPNGGPGDHGPGGPPNGGPGGPDQHGPTPPNGGPGGPDQHGPAPNQGGPEQHAPAPAPQDHTAPAPAPAGNPAGFGNPLPTPAQNGGTAPQKGGIGRI